MTSILPKIDKRSQQDLVSELRRLLLYYCPELESIEDISSDKTIDSLVNIFSNMMGHIVDALNDAPDKNFTAFLNLIGVGQTSPLPARAPMVFKLKDDWENDGFIPSGTKISAQPENQEEVVFETESDLTVIRPGLVRAAGIEPGEDKWSDLDFLFSSEPSGLEAELFRGDTRITHRMYIGHSKLFSLMGAVVNLNLKLKENSTEQYTIEWYYFDENGEPQPLKLCNGTSRSLLQNGGISFFSPERISQKQISGFDKTNTLKCWNNHWIFAQLESPVGDESLMPDVQDIKLGVDISSEALRPQAAVFNYAPIDLTKDFYPFGERPVFNDTFYMCCGEAFSKNTATITLNITLSDAKQNPNTGNIVLAWECWNNGRWSEFGRVSKNTIINIIVDPEGNETVIENVENAVGGNISTDTTCALTQSGQIIFTCPEIMSSPVNGEENFWIRVRIIDGNYGEESRVTYVPKAVALNSEAETTTIMAPEYLEATYIPPSVKELLISYTYSSKEEFPETIITENNFLMSEKAVNCFENGKTFKLFSPCVDTDPAFYLGFDRDISSLPISLFFPLTGDQVGNDPVVGWEYWNGRKWLTLSVNDAIRDFTRREIQQLVIPADIEKVPLFGSEQYWIRARLEKKDGNDESGFIKYPRINTVYANTVWASNSITVKNEIVGSSNGEPNQTFQLSRTPVLSGQAVKIQETLTQGEPAQWEEVQTFSLSESGSRHYMLDRISGIITFGDGKNGMIPPAGKDNILCDYKYGGGAGGNVKADTIKKMWDNFVQIDSAFNPVPADGGFDQEEIEEAKIRGPHTLKSMDRGITCEDIEWLVREAAPQIALVKCFPTMNRELDFMPGKATVIVVPEYDDPKPVPSQELLNEIDRYLSQRVPAVLNNTEKPCLDVIGPEYIGIGVEATVTYTTPELGKIIEGRIIDNLKEFLNPLCGGQEKTGWTLGKNLYVSEVCSVIKNTPGVDYITNINIKSSVQCYTLSVEAPKDGAFKPSVAYPAYSAVKTRDNRIVLALAQKIQAGKAVKSLILKGFREGDIIKLSCRNRPSENLLIESVDGDILECITYDGEPLKSDYPVGSDIEAEITQDLKIRSFILNQISGRPEKFNIKIAVPEARDVVYLSRSDEYTNTTPLKISMVRSGDVFLEEDELVYSDIHIINKNPELKFPYLLNRDTNVMHDLNNKSEECRIGEILKEDRRYLEKMSDAPEAGTCDYCFPK